jgi:hypothetical protein
MHTSCTPLCTPACDSRFPLVANSTKLTGCFAQISECAQQVFVCLVRILNPQPAQSMPHSHDPRGIFLHQLSLTISLIQACSCVLKAFLHVFTRTETLNEYVVAALRQSMYADMMNYDRVQRESAVLAASQRASLNPPPSSGKLVSSNCIYVNIHAYMHIRA